MRHPYGAVQTGACIPPGTKETRHNDYFNSNNVDFHFVLA